MFFSEERRVKRRVRDNGVDVSGGRPDGGAKTILEIPAGENRLLIRPSMCLLASS
jgi:hypothetical protein